MNNAFLYNHLFDYCNKEKTRYSIWVYDGSEIIQVYEEKMPNTEEIWFEFYNFSYLYWNLLQELCCDECVGKVFFNSFKIRKFLISYLLCDTNMDIVLQREENGKLTEETMKQIYRIHPRILRVLFDKFNLFPVELSQDEEMEIEKQCMKLFGKGESVQNPHPLVMTYCNLVTFWDKLGLNYWDLMKMPNNLVNQLKRMAAMDNDFHSQNLKQ